MQLLPKIGIAAAALACTASAVFGTVSDNDILRLTGAVSAVPFTQLAPGMMFEVAQGTESVTPICRFANTDSGVRRDQPRHDTYYNALGRSLPVPTILSSFVDTDSWKLQVALDWNVYAEGLAVDFRGDIDPGCETAAQHAHSRASVVCIVHSVLREPRTNEIVAVKFKPYGFTPDGVEIYPLCPLKLSGDLVWWIKRSFISVAAGRGDDLIEATGVGG